MNIKIKYIIFSVLSLLFFAVSTQEGMFWDNVLFASKMGNHLFENGIFSLSMPDSFDPGHPPFLAFILACSWKVLGHKLWVSHLAMLPFIFGLLVQLYKFISQYIKDTKYKIAAFALLLADPTLSAQFVLVNPEVIQLFFFFLAINALLEGKNKLQIIALSILGIVSFRGMMLCAGVFLFEFFNQLNFKKFVTRKLLFKYLIAALPATVYVVWRLTTKGWLQTHPGSPWEGLWHFASFKIFIFNIFTLGRWYTDFGRIFVLIFILIAFVLNFKVLQEKNIKQLLALAILSVITIIIVSLISTNTFAHRYFIASYLALILLSFVLLEKYHKYKKYIYSILLLGLLTGNLWIYPEKIAQGWDASLAHMPYFGLRKDAIQYMNNNNIDVNCTASFFPNDCSIDEVDLSGDKRIFCNFDGTSEYVFYSNIYNLADTEFDMLENNYMALKTFKNMRIHITLYKLKNIEIK